jgi:hypothetical protein
MRYFYRSLRNNVGNDALDFTIFVTNGEIFDGLQPPEIEKSVTFNSGLGHTLVLNASKSTFFKYSYVFSYSPGSSKLSGNDGRDTGY